MANPAYTPLPPTPPGAPPLECQQCGRGTEPRALLCADFKIRCPRCAGAVVIPRPLAEQIQQALKQLLDEKADYNYDYRNVLTTEEAEAGDATCRETGDLLDQLSRCLEQDNPA